MSKKNYYRVTLNNGRTTTMQMTEEYKDRLYPQAQPLGDAKDVKPEGTEEKSISEPKNKARQPKNKSADE